MISENTVSCIIPMYNSMEYVFGTIDSVLKQDYPDMELIISDDCSSVFDADKIEKHILANKGDNLKSYRIIANPENLGTVRNLNGAISHARGEYIIIVSSDDELYSDDTISCIVKRFIQTNADIIVCSREAYDEKLKKKIRLMPDPHYLKFIKKHMGSPAAQYKVMAQGNEMEFASGSAMYYRKEYFLSCGRYDERYVLWEDGPFIAKAAGNEKKIETAYDLISIKYRAGGISSKKKRSSQPSTIEKDYANYYLWEFSENSARLSSPERKVAKGLFYKHMKKKPENFGGWICLMLAYASLIRIKGRKSLLHIIG